MTVRRRMDVDLNIANYTKVLVVAIIFSSSLYNLCIPFVENAENKVYKRPCSEDQCGMAIIEPTYQPNPNQLDNLGFKLTLFYLQPGFRWSLMAQLINGLCLD